MNLAETQQIFWDALRGEAPAETLEACFVGSADLPAGDRVEIYSNMYLWRLVDALRSEFPKLAAFLGEDAFFEAMSAYVEHHPSESPDVGDFGRLLESFLRENDGGYPGVGDLAALEWAESRAFCAAEVESAAATALAALSPEVVPAARLEFIPALQLVHFERTPLPVWQAIENGESPEQIEPQPGHAAVWRKGFDVYHSSLPGDEAEALQRALAGQALGDVCDAFVGHDDAATRAFGALASWFNDGWVTAVVTV